MKLLVSPADAGEARAAVEGGADIIDVKNPVEGSLGASFPWVIREIRSVVPEGRELSATLGDLEFKPGTASLAAYGVASLGVDYAKAGLYGVKRREEALDLARGLVKGVEGLGCGVILAGYADHRSIGSLSPLLLPPIAEEVGAEGVMIDTAVKNGKGLFHHLEDRKVKAFVEEAHSRGLLAALAGSLDEEGVVRTADLGADIVGVRGLVCTGGDRREGRVSVERVREVKGLLP
jgi:hypothetical protein